MKEFGGGGGGGGILNEFYTLTNILIQKFVSWNN